MTAWEMKKMVMDTTSYSEHGRIVVMDTGSDRKVFENIKNFEIVSKGIFSDFLRVKGFTLDGDSFEVDVTKGQSINGIKYEGI